MVVYDGELTPFVQRVTQELLYTLWDLGLQVGHSLRSLDDCVAMARTDFPSRTSMQETRLIAGDRRLFARFRRVLRDNVYRHDFDQFLATTLAERDQRYRKYGASPYIGEPNVKESAGGLRDMHTAMWLGAAKFGARTLRELADKGLITPREQALADAALTFLWRVRNELHFFSGHKNDVLTRDLQPRIAKNLGYEDDAASLGVERFMREYYLHARVIHRVSRRLIARCQETLSRRGSAERRERQQALADGLVFFDGRLHLADREPRPPAARPRAAHEGVLAPPSARLRAVARPGARGGGFARPRRRRLPALAAVRDLFLDICRNWGRVALTLSEMHELGLLGRYLPEFGALTCLVQYDVYHKFSADQHSLLAVEHLEALAPGQSAESEGAAQVFNEVEKPELLMLGMLLHDIGKAKGHGHVAKGIPLDPGADRADRAAARRRGRGGVPRRPPPDDVAHRPAARHRRPARRSATSPRRGRPAAPAHALPADVRRHARGRAPACSPAGRRRSCTSCTRARSAPHRAARGRAARRTAPSSGERLHAVVKDEVAAAGGEGARGDGVGPLSRRHERAAHGRAPAAVAPARRTRRSRPSCSTTRTSAPPTSSWSRATCPGCSR